MPLYAVIAFAYLAGFVATLFCIRYMEKNGILHMDSGEEPLKYWLASLWPGLAIGATCLVAAQFLHLVSTIYYLEFLKFLGWLKRLHPNHEVKEE